MKRAEALPGGMKAQADVLLRPGEIIRAVQSPGRIRRENPKVNRASCSRIGIVSNTCKNGLCMLTAPLHCSSPEPEHMGDQPDLYHDLLGLSYSISSASNRTSSTMHQGYILNGNCFYVKVVFCTSQAGLVFRFSSFFGEEPRITSLVPVPMQLQRSLSFFLFPE